MDRVTMRAARMLRFLLPHGLVILPQVLRNEASRRELEAPILPFKVNAQLRDRHAGQRCFILCTGPSVRTQEVRRLAGELVISVSSAYLHPDFDAIHPAYHCVPNVTLGRVTRDDVIKWFEDMDAKLGQAEIVLSDTERQLVADAALFPRRQAHYLLMEGEEAASRFAVPDLTDRLPSPQSVPIMATMLALYMGCREIYLLGTDHDQFLTGSYTHFYDRSILNGKDISTDEKGQVTTSRYEEFVALGRLWRQYRWLKACAAGIGATIYNATAGGALDEFERVDFASMRLAGDAERKGISQTAMRE